MLIGERARLVVVGTVLHGATAEDLAFTYALTDNLERPILVAP